ncbi:MAG TPA: hypothetical protein VLM38_11930 [Blastocatellia bacterium]|nr:hypothetical protein [Blastocatellia bacterium]
MRRSSIVSAAVRCTAVVATLIFVGGFNSISSLGDIVVGVTECVPQPAAAMGIDELGGMLLLFVLASMMVGVGIERSITIAQAVTQSRAYERRALTALFYNRVDEAGSAAALFPGSPVASVVSASLQGANRGSAERSGISNPSKAAFQRALIAQTMLLKRRLWTLAAIGWSSPVIGLVSALGPSTRHAADPPIALLFGLAIAVPAIWLHWGLNSRVDALLLEADRMSLSIIDQMKEQIESTI